MPDDSDHTVYFYSRHPISCAIILAKLQAVRGHLDALQPEELWPHDQDHYGGLAANDALAQAAGVRRGMRIADFCAGLGGPARYLAHRYNVDVTGIELTPARVACAADLTRRVGLQERVRILAGNVMAAPLADASMDAVVSQEALLHVPDTGRALAEACRILRPGGCLAFTDWTLYAPLSEADAALLWDGLAAQDLQTPESYETLLRAAGFADIARTDLTAAWGDILRERLTMYRKLRDEALVAGTPAGHDAFHRSYVRFVALVQSRALGGARFTARKPT